MMIWLRYYFLWFVCTFFLGVIQHWIGGLLVEESDIASFIPFLDPKVCLVFCSTLVSSSAFIVWSRRSLKRTSSNFTLKHIVLPFLILLLIIWLFVIYNQRLQLQNNDSGMESFKFSIVLVLVLSYLYGSMGIFTTFRLDE